MNKTIQFMKLNEDAVIPKFAHPSDAGMDLYSTEKVELNPGDFRVIKTGLQMQMPYGFEAQIRSRSGLAAKYGVAVLNSPGTIDADYRGEIGVVLINHSKTNFIVEKGDRIAQMVISKLTKFNVKEVKIINQTERGEGGFGSTGIAKK